MHNKAIFHCFNSGVNVYRPYYELQGEIFPWNTSEKGLTFYEINDENIEEVFEKSKMKALECCASLCGLHAADEMTIDLTTEQAKQQLAKRNTETYQRVLKTEITETYHDWAVKMVNF